MVINKDKYSDESAYSGVPCKLWLRMQNMEASHKHDRVKKDTEEYALYHFINIILNTRRNEVLPLETG